MQQTSPEGLALIRSFEGLALKPYRDPGGHWTVGIGHKLTGLEPVRPITTEKAEEYFDEDVARAEHQVRMMTSGLTLTQGQFDALVDFVFNEGAHRFSKSTLLTKLKALDTKGAADEFLVWDKTHVKGELVELLALEERRRAERALFLS